MAIALKQLAAKPWTITKKTEIFKPIKDTIYGSVPKNTLGELKVVRTTSIEKKAPYTVPQKQHAATQPSSLRKRKASSPDELFQSTSKSNRKRIRKSKGCSYTFSPKQASQSSYKIYNSRCFGSTPSPGATRRSYSRTGHQYEVDVRHSMGKQRIESKEFDMMSKWPKYMHDKRLNQVRKTAEPINIGPDLMSVDKDVKQLISLAPPRQHRKNIDPFGGWKHPVPDPTDGFTSKIEEKQYRSEVEEQRRRISRSTYNQFSRAGGEIMWRSLAAPMHHNPNLKALSQSYERTANENSSRIPNARMMTRAYEARKTYASASTPKSYQNQIMATRKIATTSFVDPKPNRTMSRNNDYPAASVDNNTLDGNRVRFNRVSYHNKQQKKF